MMSNLNVSVNCLSCSAKRALDECSEMLLDKLSCKEALNLTVEGLSNFGNNVVFAKVEDGASIAILTTISGSFIDFTLLCQ